MNQLPQMHHHQQQQQHHHMNPHLHPHHHAHPHHHHQINNMQQHQIKYEMPDDPYSFVDEEMQHHSQQNMQYTEEMMLQHMPKKRGRKKKFKPEDQMG